MWQNQLGMIDILSVISFIIQVQNLQNHEIERLKHDVSLQIDQQTKVLLDTINKKLDLIIEKLNAQVG